MKTKSNATKVVRVPVELMRNLRETFDPLSPVSDLQMVNWACESFLILVKDEQTPPAIPPIAALARAMNQKDPPEGGSSRSQA
jgi:hypothetical protein